MISRRSRKTAVVAECVHCGRPFGGYHPRLCWRCRANPSTSKYGRHGVGLRSTKVMPEPTDALPGTPEKVEVLAARAERGEMLHHSLDGKLR